MRREVMWAQLAEQPAECGSSTAHFTTDFIIKVWDLNFS